jgi:hypothetical protein
MHLPFLPVLSLAALLALPATGTAQSTQPPPLLTPLPAERIVPLQGERCTCALVPAGRAGMPPPFDTVLASSTAEKVRVVLDGRERELSNARSKKIGRDWVNTYRGDDAVVTIRSRKVPFAPTCAAYPDQPSEGSCYAGELRASTGGGAPQGRPIVQVCGC